jgi:diguanylate cyclase (GGDEF)-like protein
MSTSPINPEQERLRWRALEHLFDATIVVDSARRLYFANERFRKLAQITGTEIPFGTDVADFLDIPASCWESIRAPASSTTPHWHSVPFAFNDGAKGFSQIVVDRLPRDASDTTELFICVLRDLTLEMQSKSQLDQNERVIAELRRSHAEAQFLWRLSMETPIYLEPAAVLGMIGKKLKDELGFEDASFMHVPDSDEGLAEPVMPDLRLGSRLREVAHSLVPTLRKKQSRTEVWSLDYGTYGTFWITNFRPKLEKPFFLLARSVLSVKDSNRKGFLEPLAMQITGWLDNRSMYISSITDSLTGLFNRRHFDSRFAVECLLARERQMILSLILVDIDFFKKINDSFGHQVGDTVLKTTALAIKSVLRTTDITARVGGEEFGVLLFDTSPRDAKIAAEKIRKKIAETPVPLPGFNQTITVTVSCGIAGYLGLHDSPEAVFRAADDALYKAKNSGRNCIILNEDSIIREP